MQDYDELNDEGGIGIFAVHAIATSRDTEDEQSQITAQALIYEQAKDSYSRQASYKV